MAKFKGGVHPKEEKRTRDIPLRPLPPPPKLTLLLSQHTGKPSSPKVKRGDPVEPGQLVAEAQGLISANLHSPVRGKVSAVKDGAIIIETQEEGKIPREEDPNWEDLPREEIVARVREAGIVGMGGAAFPTHVKLAPPAEYPIDTVIINGAECEPYLTVDDRLMREYPEEIVSGAYLIKRATGAERVVIGIEANKPEAAEALRPHAQRRGFRVEVLPVKYPQGSEKHLIKAITGREVPSGGLPFHVGVVVQNVGTTRAIYRAVRYREPLTHRPLTLSGSGAAGPGNYILPIGSPFSHLVELTGGTKGEVIKAINGGPMMGVAMPDLAGPITKGTTGLLLLTWEDTWVFPEQGPCIRCASCVGACPMGLLPYKIALLSDAGKIKEALELGLLDCIECGSCAYVCPSRRFLVQSIRYGKVQARLAKEAAK